MQLRLYMHHKDLLLNSKEADEGASKQWRQCLWRDARFRNKKVEQVRGKGGQTGVMQNKHHRSSTAASQAMRRPVCNRIPVYLTYGEKQCYHVGGTHHPGMALHTPHTASGALALADTKLHCQ